MGNPTHYTDPSGHKYCEGESSGDCRTGNPYSGLSFDELFGIEFNPNDTWDPADQSFIREAVAATGKRLADSTPAIDTPWAAFRANYRTGSGDNLVFSIGHCPECGDVGGITDDYHHIRFSALNGGNHTDRELRGVNNVVHELGHAFNKAWVGQHGAAGSPVNQLDNSMQNDPNLRRNGDVVGNYGFASASNVYTWQMHGQGPDAGTAGEIFADQFLGWTFNTWDPDPLSVSAAARADWMNQQMGNYVVP